MQGRGKNAKGVRVKRKFGISRGRRKTIWEKECRNWGAGRREVMSGDKEKARIILYKCFINERQYIEFISL